MHWLLPQKMHWTKPELFWVCCNFAFLDIQVFTLENQLTIDSNWCFKCCAHSTKCLLLCASRCKLGNSNSCWWYDCYRHGHHFLELYHLLNHLQCHAIVALFIFEFLACQLLCCSCFFSNAAHRQSIRRWWREFIRIQFLVKPEWQEKKTRTKRLPKMWHCLLFLLFILLLPLHWFNCRYLFCTLFCHFAHGRRVVLGLVCFLNIYIF